MKYQEGALDCQSELINFFDKHGQVVDDAVKIYLKSGLIKGALLLN